MVVLPQLGLPASATVRMAAEAAGTALDMWCSDADGGDADLSRLIAT